MESLIFGEQREATEPEEAFLFALARECAPAVFKVLNKRLNYNGLCLKIDALPKPEQVQP